MTNKYRKKRSTILAINEMQIKIVMRFHLTSVRMAIIKETNKCSEDAWGRGRTGKEP
jgi:hypothetical protein